jgi:ribosomal protein L37AE/L43A
MQNLSGYTTDDNMLCPYCRRPLRWSPVRSLSRGVFECESCGEFTDFRRFVRGAVPSTLGAQKQTAAGHKG